MHGKKEEIRGAYLLIVENNSNIKIKIGKNNRDFKKGFYIYCGSGMKNMEKRIARHFSNNKKLRWHIDYITTKMSPKIAFAIISDEKIECDVAKIISENFYPKNDFGSTDCNCKTHLFFSSEDPVEKIKKILKSCRLNYYLIKAVPIIEQVKNTD